MTEFLPQQVQKNASPPTHSEFRGGMVLPDTSAVMQRKELSAAIQRRKEAMLDHYIPGGIQSKVPTIQRKSSALLPLPVQNKMETTMGADFSNVNIHPNSQQAQEVGALAYTQGNDVHFAPGQFDPHTQKGQSLIGHELAHVVQQRQGRVQATTQAKGLPVNDDPGLEKEADVIGEKAAQMKGDGGASILDKEEKEPAQMKVAQMQGDEAVKANGGQLSNRVASNTLQRKSSSLADLVSPVAVLARNTALAQMKKLGDYNDADPKHDASLVSDADIKGTDEHLLLMQTYLLVPTTDASTLYSEAEILLACRLMLRAMREGTTVDAGTQGKAYLDRARMQIGTAAKAEAHKDKLSWQTTFPGSNNSEFGKWLLDGGPEPNAKSGVMNCWELVMFSAYEAKFATFAGLQAVYKQFAKDLTTDIPKAVTTFENALKQGKEQVFDPNNADSPRPLRGDIVIFNTLASHVAIATGGQQGGSPEIMSLWTQNSKTVYQTTIAKLLLATAGPVRFFSPKWS